MLNRTLKYVFVFLLAGIMLASAARTFSATANSFKTTRGAFTSSGLSISNCDNPSDKQYSIVVLKLKYPRDYCSGQMDVYYSYYDFSTEEYTDEEKLCIIGSDESCDARINIWFGGKGEGKASLDEWIKLRAVCRYDDSEYTYSIPMDIEHTPSNYEAEMLDKIQDAEAVLNAAKAELANCLCCDKTMLGDVEAQLNALKRNLSRCDFSNMVQSITNAKDEAEQLKDKIKNTACETGEDAGSTSEQESESGEQETGEQQEPAHPVESEPNLQPAQSACPLTAILLIGISLLSLAGIRNR